MRNLIRTLLLLLLLAAVFPFVYPWKDGKPLLSWSDLKISQLPSLKLPEVSLAGNEAPREAHQPVKIYRWQGAEGTLQFSNEAPAPGVAYEVVEVNPDANLIQAPAKEENTAARETDATTTTAPAPALPSPLTVSPGQALQLIDDARNIQGLSEERRRRQEALTQ